MPTLPTKLNPLGNTNSNGEGSVQFLGEIGSNLFSQFSSQPSIYSFTCWMKSISSPTQGCFIKVGVKDGEYGSTYGSGVGLGFGQTSYGQLGNNLIVLREGVAFTSVGQISNPNIWHHYAMCINGNSVQVYVDGSIKSTTTQAIHTFSTCFIYFGGFSEPKRYINCKMTRCAMWNKILSATDIQLDYADGKNKPTLTNGLQHFWPMSSRENYLLDEIGNNGLIEGELGVTLSNDSPFT